MLPETCLVAHVSQGLGHPGGFTVSCCFRATKKDEKRPSLSLTGASLPLSQCLIHIKPGLSGHTEFHRLGWWGAHLTSCFHKHCRTLQDLDDQATAWGHGHTGTGLSFLVLPNLPGLSSPSNLPQIEPFLSTSVFLLRFWVSRRNTVCLNSVFSFIHSAVTYGLRCSWHCVGSGETGGCWRHCVCRPCFQTQAWLGVTATSSFPGSGPSPWRLTLKPLPGLSPLTPCSHDEGVVFPPVAAEAKAGHCILGWRHQRLGGKIAWRGEQDWSGVIRPGDPRYEIIKRCPVRPGAMRPPK